MVDTQYSPFKEAHECCTALLNCVPVRDRLRAKQQLIEFMDVANESVDDRHPIKGAGRSQLVEALYKDVMSKGNVDYGKIPLSRGDITKVPYYKTMCDSMESLNKLVGDNANPDMIRMNKLHEVIIQERANFEFGFKANVEFIQYVYCALTEALMDLINTNIVYYVDYLKETRDIDMDAKFKRTNDTTVARSVDTFLSLREKGEWGKLMAYYKKNVTKQFATEIFSIIAIATFSIVAFTALIWAIRGLIYTYYYTAVKVDEKARAMSIYLDAVSKNEKDKVARAKQKYANTQLQNIASFIETKIIKDDIVAQREMQKADAAISRAALLNPNPQKELPTTVASTMKQDDFDFSF